MDWKTIKLLLHVAFFALVNSQLPTTSEPPPTSSLPAAKAEEQPPPPDAATIEQYNLTIGAANIDYGPYAYHRKYVPTGSDLDFSYDDNDPRGPSNWSKQWPLCSGLLQSPINVNVEECGRQPYAVPMRYFNINQPSNVTIENNGYSIEYLFKFTSTPILYGGPLSEGFVFEFIHFHWGENDTEGSEHYLNGQKYQLEMHAGHRHSKYRDLAEAAQFEDGISVLGFLFQVSDLARDNPIFRVIDQLAAINSTIQLNGPHEFSLGRFVGNLVEEFVTTRGSLTTPPCAPANWLLATRSREISRSDMNRFRRTAGRTVNHYRPIQMRQNLTCSIY